MITTCSLNHVRYVGSLIQAIEVTNQEYKNNGLNNNLEIEGLSISKASVTIQYNRPEELFRLGLFTNALMSNSPF